jgi:NAD(P)-dependent dehydrogenase (short-subunit alcohol dehydrogenase family)
MSKFKDKNVLITGGSTGMGLATAKAFIEAGAKVAITGKNADNLKKAAAWINSPNLKTITSDTANLKDIDQLADIVAKSGHKLDVLFLNAGIAQFAPIDQNPEELFDNMFGVNVKGLYFTLQKLLTHLADGASVVLTSSVVSTGAMANGSVYAATKAAVTSIGRAAAIELAPRKIRVNIVSPGPIDTPIFGKTGMSEEMIQGFKGMMTTASPLGRLGTSEEIAHAVLFLSSPEASYITGTDLLVDGGVGLRK